MTVPNYCHITPYSYCYFIQSKLGLNLESKEWWRSATTKLHLVSLDSFRQPAKPGAVIPLGPSSKMTHVSHEDILAGSIGK